MADHVERIRGSLSEIRTAVAAAQDLTGDGALRSMMAAVGREVEEIELALEHVYDSTAPDPAGADAAEIGAVPPDLP